MKIIYPKNDPRICFSMNNLGIILQDLQKIEEAEMIYNESHELMKKILPKYHPDIVHLKFQLSKVQIELLKLEQAE